MIRKEFIQENGTLVARVKFVLPNSTWASSIHLVGDFNDWNTSSHPFQCERDGTWVASVDLEANRAYQFRYLCDGQCWSNDNQADGYVWNPYGSDNCLVITDPDFKPYRDGR